MGEMSRSVSIFFNTDRTYLTYIEKQSDGLELLYLNSTDNKIDLAVADSDESISGMAELRAMFEEIGGAFDRVAITLPAESVFVSKIPGGSNLDTKDLKRMVNFEIRQLFPQFNFEDFITTVTPLAPTLDGKSIVLCAIIPNDVLSVATSAIAPLSNHVDSIEISQLSAHTALRYNYPELADKNIVLASIQSQFIDISLSKGGVPAYYNLISFSSIDKIGEVLEKEFEKILAESAESLDGAFFFGNNLNKEILMACWETAMLVGIEAKRLNPFRMMRSSLGRREREYCSRTFQIYPACVGGSLPSYHHRIKLY